MIKHTVGKKESGKTIESILVYSCGAERNSLYKAFRVRDVKVNGVRVNSNCKVYEDDVIEAYIHQARGNDKYYSVLYENDSVLIVNKKQGIPVQADRHDENTLIDSVRKDFGMGCELCHRIDRNTGGIVIISKNKDHTSDIKDAINRNVYVKQYRSLLYGDASDCVGINKAWHFKDSRESRVYIYASKRKYSKEITTEIKAVSFDKKRNISETDINLVTGRTHQIRAHMAFLGHPVIGDGKYGIETLNRKYGYRYQALWACALVPAQDAAGDTAFVSGLLPYKTVTAPVSFE